MGVIGTGVATQAIHLPVLATLKDRLRVTHVVGSDERHVAAIARRVDARAGTSVEALLDDPAVDLVAVCGRDQDHAAHVTAACAAGKRGVLVEKPLATTRHDATAIAAAAARYGVPVVVGAMHAWDPAWRAASRVWLEEDVDAHLIRSTIHLPANAVVLDRVTELAERHGRHVPPRLVARVAAARRELRPPDVAAREARLKAVLTGFAVHAVPLIRVLAPGLEEVVFAAPVFPWGYATAYDSGRATVAMTGSIGGHWTPTWSFDAWAVDRHLHVDFPPAFVPAGSGEASISGPDRTLSWRMPQSGYQAEWLHLADVAEGRAGLSIDVATAVADLHHVISLAEAGAEALHRGSES